MNVSGKVWACEGKAAVSGQTKRSRPCRCNSVSSAILCSRRVLDPHIADEDKLDREVAACGLAGSRRSCRKQP